MVRGRNFRALGVALTAPQGFRIVNGSDRVLLVNGGRDAALMMRLVPDELLRRTGSSHDAILRQGLGTTDGRVEKLTLGGSLQATHFVGRRRDARGNVGPLDATIVDGPGGQVSAGASGAMRRRWSARATLREAELSFRPLRGHRAAAGPGS